MVHERDSQLATESKVYPNSAQLEPIEYVSKAELRNMFDQIIKEKSKELLKEQNEHIEEPPKVHQITYRNIGEIAKPFNVRILKNFKSNDNKKSIYSHIQVKQEVDTNKIIVLIHDIVMRRDYEISIPQDKYFANENQIIEYVERFISIDCKRDGELYFYFDELGGYKSTILKEEQEDSAKAKEEVQPSSVSKLNVKVANINFLPSLSTKNNSQPKSALKESPKESPKESRTDILKQAANCLFSKFEDQNEKEESKEDDEIQEDDEDASQNVAPIHESYEISEIKNNNFIQNKHKEEQEHGYSDSSLINPDEEMKITKDSFKSWRLELKDNLGETHSFCIQTSYTAKQVPSNKKRNLIDNSNSMEENASPLLLSKINFLIKPLKQNHTYTLAYTFPEKFNITLDSQELIDEIIKVLIDHYIILGPKNILILDHHLHQVLESLDMKESPHTGEDFIDALTAQFNSEAYGEPPKFNSRKYDSLNSSHRSKSKLSQKEQEEIFELPRDNENSHKNQLESGGSFHYKELESDDNYDFDKFKINGMHSETKQEESKSNTHHDMANSESKANNNEIFNDLEDNEIGDEIGEEFEEQDISSDYYPKVLEDGYEF